MSVNAAFVKAITTIKTLTKSPNSLGKPPLENKTVLYGLYKQATEGDVEGIMGRPQGQSPHQKANQRKWDAWKAQQGLTKDEAKLKYIEYLLETMRQVSPDTPQSRGLVNELTTIYLAAKGSSGGTGLGVGTGPGGGATHGVAGLAGGPNAVPHISTQISPQTSSPLIPGTSTPVGHNRTWSNTSSAYGQFLRRPTYSEFGLSVGDRTERMSEVSDLPNDPGIHAPEAGSPGGIQYADPSWQSNVSWQLETISEEINSMRRRYEPPQSSDLPQTPSSSLRRPFHTDEPPKKPENALNKIALWVLVHGKRVFKRMAIDTAVLTMFLILIRVVQGSPTIMSNIPVTRKLFSVVGNVIAVVLREVGFEIKPRVSGSGPSSK